MRMLRMWLVIVFVLGLVSFLPAEIFTPTDDARIRGGSYADTNYGNENGLFVKRVSYSLSYSRKVYIKFDISSLSQPAASAELALTIRSITPGESLAHELAFWGLADSLDASWSEDTITWNNAPANVKNSGWEFDASNAVHLGNISLPEIGVLQAGDVITFSSQALVDFINSDTNGFITIMISRITISDENGPVFASKEHETYPGPRLIITPVPEPAGIGLLLLGLGLVRRR